MTSSVFVQAGFWCLVLASTVVPVTIYGGLLLTNNISRITVAAFGIVLIAFSGLDLILLRTLRVDAAASTSLFDDAVFASEFSVAFYLLPLVSASIGTNLLSHILISHLRTAEILHDKDLIGRAPRRSRSVAEPDRPSELNFDKSA